MARFTRGRYLIPQLNVAPSDASFKYQLRARLSEAKAITHALDLDYEHESWQPAGLLPLAEPSALLP